MYIHKRVRLRTKKTKAYVNNRDFYQAIVDYQALVKLQTESNAQLPTMTKYIGECLMLICTNLAKKPNFYNYCVDTETEALTKRGWLKYDQITLQDEILSLDPVDRTLKWSKIHNLYVGHHKGMMHRLTGMGIDALVTPGHKFLTKEQGIQPVEHLRVKDHVIVGGQHECGPTTQTYSDEFVELVGWSVTEGHYMKRDGVRKTSLTINVGQKAGPKSDRIIDALDRYYLIRSNERKGSWEKAGPYGLHQNTDTNMNQFNLRGELAEDIQRVAPDRVLSMDFILSLTHDQRELLIKTMIDGDGNTTSRGGKPSFGYAQKCKKHFDAFLSLLILAGYTARTAFRQHDTPFGYAEYYTLYIPTKPKRECYIEKLNFHGGRSGKGGGDKIANPNIPTQEYDGVVWCPQTEYGTFMCRRGAYHYITGNSYKDEFVSDAIENCCAALKNFDPKKSTNPFAYFTQVAYNAFIRRLNKEKDQAVAKVKNFERLYLMSEIFDEDIPLSLQLPTNEFTDELLRNHESRVANKKLMTKKRKKKKVLKVRKNLDLLMGD